MENFDPSLSEIERSLRDAVALSRGHFVYESGHHGDLWLELESLFFDARRIQRWAAALATQVVACHPELICGPLTGGAFIAQALAAETGAGFIFAEQLFSKTGWVQYRIPASLRKTLQGRRTLLVDDAINAGSALSATLADLLACGARPAGFAAFLTLGEAASQIARQHDVPLFTLASLERRMWLPEACPLCRSGEPLVVPSALPNSNMFAQSQTGDQE